ncbi:hypothetical protein SAMN04487948_101235 [Halogranum amylolyticum]|uniref:Zinc-ribbon domain-containing protein n=1 Tax=Halogranum amylolyticum TaxID=660520 RepID=A0A1H8N0T1_9EURY|nr:hypothetical protein [Halogranum amylolyticum]SEO23251.1 hypothetical protein SAMN04487948_101235 [Halogranum amylolyticum]
MTGCPRIDWASPLRDLLSVVAERPDGTDAGYFCRACGTTLEAHQATCPDCGSRMLEPTHDTETRRG